MRGRILAVDPGEKRIGLAVSDQSGTIANPLCVISHTNRMADAGMIAQIAGEQGAILIVVGQALDSDGMIGPQARKAQRLADAIRSQSELPLVMWDESNSTQQAQQARKLMGVRRSRMKGHMDDLAATVILQSYLDAQGQG